MSRKLYTIRPQKLKVLIINHTTAFRWYDCRWPWRYFKVIRLFHIKFLLNVALYGKSYYRVLIGNHALAFDWCHFCWPGMTFDFEIWGCYWQEQEERLDIALQKNNMGSCQYKPYMLSEGARLYRNAEGSFRLLHWLWKGLLMTVLKLVTGKSQNN